MVEGWSELEQERLVDLVGQIVALVQIMRHSYKKDQRLATLQEQEDQLMTRAEDLWKRIAKTQQGIGIPESSPKVSEWEVAKRVGQCQTLGREKASLLPPTPPPVTASTTVLVGLELTPSWSTPEEDTARGRMPPPLCQRIPWQKRVLQLPPTLQS